MYSTSQKFLHLSFRLESPFNLLRVFVRSANVKSSVTCESVLCRDDVGVGIATWKIWNSRKRLTVHHLGCIIIVFRGHFDLLYIIYMYTRVRILCRYVRIICSDPSLSRLRISLLVARHGICKDRRYRI